MLFILMAQVDNMHWTRTFSFVCLRALDLALGKRPQRPARWHTVGTRIPYDSPAGCGVIGVASPSKSWCLFFCLSAGGAKRLVFITCITIPPPPLF